MRTIVVVGAGALGSHAVQLLRNEDVKFKVIDFDRVESRNVMSQFHTRAGVGKSKVQALQGTLQFLWGLRIETIPHKLVVDNAKQLLGRADLVLDCLDNGESRRLVQKTVRALKIPCLHGALAAGGSFGRVIWDENFVVDDEPEEGAATCENGEHLPFIVIVSAYIARTVQEFLSSGKRVQFNIHPAGAIRA